MSGKKKEKGGNAHQRAIQRELAPTPSLDIPDLPIVMGDQMTAKGGAINKAKAAVQTTVGKVDHKNLVITVLVAFLTTVASNFFSWTQAWQVFREPLVVSVVGAVNCTPDGPVPMRFYYGKSAINSDATEPNVFLSTILSIRLRNRNASPVEVINMSVSAVTSDSEIPLRSVPGVPGLQGRVFHVRNDGKEQDLNLTECGFDYSAMSSPINAYSDLKGLVFLPDPLPEGTRYLRFKFTDTTGAKHNLKAPLPPLGEEKNPNVLSYEFTAFAFQAEKPPVAAATTPAQMPSAK